MTKPNRDRIAKTFKQLLIKNNTNAYRSAKETGIDKTYLSKLSSGAIANPGKDKLIKIAQALKIEPSRLLTVFTNPEIAVKEFGLAAIDLSQSQTGSQPRRDWGTAPDRIVCYDRKAEIDAIKHWINSQRCRIVNLYGLGGIGKTTLAIEVAKQLESDFDYILWRSLDNISLFENPIQDALGLFGTKKNEATSFNQRSY